MRLRTLCFGLLMVTLAQGFNFSAEYGQQADGLQKTGEANEDDPLEDPRKVEGHRNCVDCHKPEIQAWRQSKHATRAFDLLRTSPTSVEYAKKLNIRESEITSNSLCVRCHATTQIDYRGKRKVLPSVSCEACHGASGGEGGWLNPHAVYGPFGTRREQESSDHLAFRKKVCDVAGQRRSDDLYGLAKRCFECHVVDSEPLALAGHDHGDGFELVLKTTGEVRHNLFLDPTENALTASLWVDPMHHGDKRNASGRLRIMLLVGQLVDLEISFTNLAKGTADNDFTELLVERIEEAFEFLAEDILEELEDLEITTLPEVEFAIEQIESIIEDLDDDGFDPDQRDRYRQAAAVAAVAAQKVAQRNGNGLKELDQLDLLPEIPTKGVYRPDAVGESE